MPIGDGAAQIADLANSYLNARHERDRSYLNAQHATDCEKLLVDTLIKIAELPGPLAPKFILRQIRFWGWQAERLFPVIESMLVHPQRFAHALRFFFAQENYLRNNRWRSTVDDDRIAEYNDDQYSRFRKLAAIFAAYEAATPPRWKFWLKRQEG